MRKWLFRVWPALVFATALALPASTAATGGFTYSVVHDYCGGPMGWTNYYKVWETADGLTTTNRLTIDSWGQEKYASDPHPHWVTVKTWSRVSRSFTLDGTNHSRALARSWAGGNIEQASRIVFTLRAWHNSTLLWTQRVHSTYC